MATKKLGSAPNVPKTTKKKTKKKSIKELRQEPADMADVAEDTRKADEQAAQSNASATGIKQCHALVTEMSRGLTLARTQTTPPGTIVHVLERVIEATEEVAAEATAAMEVMTR